MLRMGMPVESPGPQKLSSSNVDLENSVRHLVAKLGSGDSHAERWVWDEYFTQLVTIARRQLSGRRTLADEEDVALSAIGSLCRGAAAGRLDDVANRDELWYFLLAVTRRKVVNEAKREGRLKRGGGANREDRAMDQITAAEPPPDLIAGMEEEYERLLETLPDDTLRDIAVQRMEGHSVAEIASQLSVVPRTVERKLARIRDLWSRELSE